MSADILLFRHDGERLALIRQARANYESIFPSAPADLVMGHADPANTAPCEYVAPSNDPG